MPASVIRADQSGGETGVLATYRWGFATKSERRAIRSCRRFFRWDLQRALVVCLAENSSNCLKAASTLLRATDYALVPKDGLCDLIQASAVAFIKSNSFAPRTDHNSVAPHPFVCRHCGAPMIVVCALPPQPHIRAPPAPCSP